MPVDDQDAAALREFLATRDVPCPACKYNLRGLSSGSCPECNQPLKLRVSLVEPAGAAYVGTVVGLAIGAGAAMLLATTSMVMTAAKGAPPGSALLLLVAYPLIALLILGTWLWSIASREGRRRFASSTPTMRRNLVISAWCASLGAFLLWLVLVYANT